MIIWSALLIPVCTAVILLVWFQHKTTWWELLIPMGVSILLCTLMKYSVQSYQTRDTEYWTGWVEKAEYYEAWTETYTTTSTDSKGNTTTQTHYVYHPPTWNVVDSNNVSVGISSSEYRRYVRLFGNETEHGLIRWGQSSWGDGDMYYSNWDRKDTSFTVVTTAHTYENRIQASDNIVNYPEVDPEGLFAYPSASYNKMPSILGRSGPANQTLSRINARIGRSKQVRIWLLIFEDQPIERAVDQEALWVGGNKNEFVVCVGATGDQINWSYVFSWTEVEELKVGVKAHILEQETLNLPELVTYLGSEVQAKFVRKEFADFSYITVDPPGWTVWLTLFLTLLVNGGLSYWLVTNEHHDEPKQRPRRIGSFR